jgi:hypothetical protein
MKPAFSLGTLTAFLLPVSLGTIGGQEIIKPDLSRVVTDDWTVVNRRVAVAEEEGVAVVTLDSRPGSGVAWLEGVEFGDGTIELRMRGRNVTQRSFLGVAIRGSDDEAYDAVYFRPFNFLADNTSSRDHGVQYVSHPTHTWARLRQEYPGVFESIVKDPPNPDAFFKATIVVQNSEIRVFVNDAKTPCLVVRELSNRSGGKIGLWVGNNSDGQFADLVIRPAGLT